MVLMMMERVGDRWEKMEVSCSTGQSPQWAVVPVEEEEEEEEEEEAEEEEDYLPFSKIGKRSCNKWDGFSTEWDRQCKYNNEVLSSNHCCLGQKISIQ
jgi:hypothetical protein